MQETNAQRTVLIVEDDRPLAEALGETLNRDGLHPVLSHSGEQGLALARLLHPDLILLDVALPGMSGMQLFETLKSMPLTAGIPVVFVTARTRASDIAQATAAGARGYLTKPFSPTQLIDLVEEILSDRPSPGATPPLDLSAEPADQLAVYARELNRLYEREREERAALERAHRRLDDLSRSKAEFLGVVTHELLTPFAKIGLPLQVMQRTSATLSPDQAQALEDLATEIANLYRLVNGVVKFAELVNKRREPQPGHISLGQVILPAVQPVALLAEARRIDFRVFIPPGLAQVYADPELLGEAVYQMAHNGVKFNQPGGRVQVRAVESPGTIVVSVSDTGVGLAQEQLAVLGKPFEQNVDALKRGQEGLGIGWSFVCYVAKVHGGRTYVESLGPGQGSTFFLALPSGNGSIRPLSDPGAQLPDVPLSFTPSPPFPATQ